MSRRSRARGPGSIPTIAAVSLRLISSKANRRPIPGSKVTSGSFAGKTALESGSIRAFSIGNKRRSRGKAAGGSLEGTPSNPMVARAQGSGSLLVRRETHVLQDALPRARGRATEADAAPLEDLFQQERKTLRKTATI